MLNFTHLGSAAFIRLTGKLIGIDKPHQNQAPGVSFSLFGYLVSFEQNVGLLQFCCCLKEVLISG